MEMVWVKVRDMTSQRGQLDKHEFGDMKPIVLEIVGFIAREDDNDLVLMSERYSSDYSGRDFTAIPKETILERRTLKFADSGKEKE